MLAWLEGFLARADAPARGVIRRLNRAEYNNTVRDLLGVTSRPADDFPPDVPGHGFDNVGGTLTVSPALVEKYLTAAEKVANQASSRSKPATSINSISRRGAPSLVIWMDTLPSLRRRNSKWPSRSIWALICRVVSNRRADGEPGTTLSARAVSWATSA